MTDSLEMQTFCERFCYLIALMAYLLWEALWVLFSLLLFFFFSTCSEKVSSHADAPLRQTLMWCSCCANGW
jgi:hypothetical protein